MEGPKQGGPPHGRCLCPKVEDTLHHQAKWLGAEHCCHRRTVGERQAAWDPRLPQALLPENMGCAPLSVLAPARSAGGLWSKGDVAALTQYEEHTDRAPACRAWGGSDQRDRPTLQGPLLPLWALLTGSGSLTITTLTVTSRAGSQLAGARRQDSILAGG